MLIPSKFSGYEFGIRLYPSKGGSAPPPPDYTAAARATASGNLDAARYATNANRINQVTPYGSLTYSRTQPTFNQAGYDAAMTSYNAGTPVTQMDADGGSYTSMVGARGGPEPRREDFTGPDDGGGWTQTMNLTPQAQSTLDSQMALSNQYADTATRGFANVQGLLENPNIDRSAMPAFRGIDQSQIGDVRSLNSDMSGVRGLNSDMSGIRNLNTDNLNSIRNLNANGLQNVRQLGLDGLPQAPINAGQTAQDALYSRMNPSLARDEEALRTRLANQGISLGSSAYNREMDLQGQRANDMRLQAAAQGIGLDQAARQSAFGERKDLSAFDQSLNNQQFGQRQAMTAADMAQRTQGFGENQAMSGFDLTKNQQQFGQNQAITAADLARNQQQFSQQQSQTALDLQKRQQDIGLQSALANSQNAQRQAMTNEAYTDQSRPLDLVNALRTGAQVQNPQFNSFAQQQTTTGPDLLGAANSQYGAAMNAYNADQASSNAMMGGLMGIGGQFAGSAAGSAAIAALF